MEFLVWIGVLLSISIVIVGTLRNAPGSRRSLAWFGVIAAVLCAFFTWLFIIPLLDDGCMGELFVGFFILVISGPIFLISLTAAILGFGWRPRGERREELTQSLKDEESSIRWNAAWKLGKMGDARLAEPLIAALKDENSNVRSEAAIALGEIKDIRGAEPLIIALKDQDSNVRKWAASALGKMKEAYAVAPLITALGDEHPAVRRKVAEALGWIGDSRAIDPLIDALKDEGSEVRGCAAWSLEKITGKDFRKEGAKWYEWWEQNKDAFLHAS